MKPNAQDWLNRVLYHLLTGRANVTYGRAYNHDEWQALFESTETVARLLRDRKAA